jgi:uncharacterized protein YbcC (UPF0753/DUF2309 family)
MTPDTTLDDHIDAAAEAVGSVWPLHSFVTANPLEGYEDRSFEAAVAEAAETLDADPYPDPETFRRAWADGRIDEELIRSELREHGYDDDPQATLDRMHTAEYDDARTRTDDTRATTAADRVDAVLGKWLAAFLEQGTAAWPMPNREAGFYEAFREVAAHDSAIPDREAVADLPADPQETIRERLAEYPVDRWTEILEHHLTALPGWVGFVKRQAADGEASAWGSAHPITLADYLAARLALTAAFDAPVAPPADSADSAADDQLPLRCAWVRAWEATYRSELVDAVADASPAVEEGEGGRPDAQLVFCIDTRSEIIRRHVEAAGDYETHGYAGFFGVPMRYEGYDEDVTVDACPPIVDAQHRIADQPAENSERRNAHDRWRSILGGIRGALKDLRSNAATAFSFVESAGAGYGSALAARTLFPERVFDLLDRTDERVPDPHEFCEPTLERDPAADGDLPAGLALDERVEYAATAVELLGIEEFARVVAFVGHASHTTNNPFDSSLDCGACAGNPGGPNARVLAAICNDPAVRERLRQRGIDVPDDTVFVAGEHETTTDEVTLFDGDVPESHAEDLRRLREDLATARAGAAAERADDMGADPDRGVRETERRAADWAETRPEWGLAGNAGFVIGPRDLTADLDLDGRSLLHSYDWRTDPDGEALAAILTGPMVVTQQINAQYYFATVDPAAFGGGSKVTHNPVGNVGVYQGNGGDLMSGLPKQSLVGPDGDPYHQPLRLSTVVHAPVERVTEILAEHEDVAELLDNDWLWLTVVDPTRDHRPFRYAGGLAWDPVGDGTTEHPRPPAAPTVADD